MRFHLFFSFFPFVILLVAVMTWLRPLRLGRTAFAIWLLALGAASAKFVCFWLAGGAPFAPELPERLIWAWNWAYSGFLILAALGTIDWLSRLFLGLRPDGMRSVRLVGLPLLSWGLAAWGVWNGLAVPRVRAFEIGYAGLPEELDGYRLVQISDLHASAAAEGWRTRAVVERVNALDADLVCITGDSVDGTAERSGRLAAIADLRAKDGVYAVTGNHEFYWDWPGWSGRHAAWNIRFLRNECVFPRPSLALGGVNDPACALFDFDDEPWPDVEAAFAGATNGEFRVLLEHRPGNARQNFANGRVNLQLSGHAHGGVMPILSSLVAWHNDGFVRGAYPMSRKDAWLHVSPGTGQWAGFPVRFFNPSEITLITLRKVGDRR